MVSCLRSLSNSMFVSLNVSDSVICLKIRRVGESALSVFSGNLFASFFSFVLSMLSLHIYVLVLLEISVGEVHTFLNPFGTGTYFYHES